MCVLFVEMSEGLRIAAFVAAAIALITAIVHYCPANAVLAIDSCRKAA